MNREEWYDTVYYNFPSLGLYFEWEDGEFGIHCRICDDYLGEHGIEPRDFLCSDCNKEMGC